MTSNDPATLLLIMLSFVFGVLVGVVGTLMFIRVRQSEVNESSNDSRLLEPGRRAINIRDLPD